MCLLVRTVLVLEKRSWLTLCTQALGCVPAVPGYFKAIKEVCREYGALLILDEVMSGIGRTGSHHAWQQEGIVPDIQTVGKGLGGGYQPVAGVLVHKDVVDTLESGSA
jgi:adenosylmethionine-8-amino-7-oxononanoate aminotransferase